MDNFNEYIGFVVIGRNEGERLRQCLMSVIGYAHHVVYVDSGSTDCSVDLAKSLGAQVVCLDLSIPFTAARARNEGFRRLLELAPALNYVQFVDGDCEVVSGWMEAAICFLNDHSDVAVVCGRRRERFPERSVYNRLCDIEWDTPIGEARACGGDAMMRVSAFLQAGGYRENLIAGEEPELCLRLRLAGWKVWRLQAEMTRHDAALLMFWQWWRRCIRGGHAFAESAHLYGHLTEQPGVWESRRAWLWGLGIPLGVLTAVLVAGVWGLMLLIVYPLQVLRLSRQGAQPWRVRFLRALFLVLGKFPEMVGQLRFRVQSLVGAKARLIEYK